jgi:hypothetical protein
MGGRVGISSDCSLYGKGHLRKLVRKMHRQRQVVWFTYGCHLGRLSREFSFSLTRLLMNGQIHFSSEVVPNLLDDGCYTGA